MQKRGGNGPKSTQIHTRNPRASRSLRSRAVCAAAAGRLSGAPLTKSGRTSRLDIFCLQFMASGGDAGLFNSYNVNLRYTKILIWQYGCSISQCDHISNIFVFKMRNHDKLYLLYYLCSFFCVWHSVSYGTLPTAWLCTYSSSLKPTEHPQQLPIDDARVRVA